PGARCGTSPPAMRGAVIPLASGGRCGMAAMVLIYNAGGVEVHDVKPLRHVVTMLHRGVARVLEGVDGESFGPYERPHSVELVRYVYARWRYERTAPATFSFKAVLQRDRYTCAYCGRSATTID